MRSKLFEEILQTEKYPDHKTMKRLDQKGYKLVVLGNDADRELPDVHGIPPGYLEYGRCGVGKDGSLFMIGGSQGSKEGHPHSLKWGGYWGTKEVKGNGIVFVRGRAGVTEAEIRKVEIPIIDWISKNISRV